MKYEKTEDPNIIKQIETVESEIYLDKLEKQIVALEKQINGIPALIERRSYPAEILLLIDKHNTLATMRVNKEGLEAELKTKQDLLTMLEKL